MAKTTESGSAQDARKRFGGAKAAEKYAAAHQGSATHRRETRCISQLLNDVPIGASVLDLPCGAGRFLPLLHDELGLTVTEADSSPHMVEQAQQSATGDEFDDVTFAVADALATGFPNDSFDAVVCNRLFHHFNEQETRVAALKELRRICVGPIVISFFCSLSWDAAIFRIKNTVRMRKPTDRVPIRRSAFESNARAAGLKITRTLATRPGISSQWYLRLERA